MKNDTLRSLFSLLWCIGATAMATDIHVATTGSDDNDGTEAAPLLTIHHAMTRVQPGDRILLHAGTYLISERIKIPALATTAERRCELRAYPDSAVGQVIIDGSAMHHTTQNEFKMGRCIYVNHEANYWTFYGLTLQNAEDNGMKMEGSYNIVERCTFRWNNDTGLQIGMYKDFSIEETKQLPISGEPQFNPGYTYCRYNKVINCDSYENYDSRTYNGTDDGGDADGFACKLFPGPGTEFYGCRAWSNSDDNWDLYMVYHPVVIDHCWSYHAGYLADGTEGKNGNGFKLGGGGSSGGAAFDQSVGAHVVTNSIAFDNLHKGFDQNNAYEGMYLINCVAWGNDYNYRFPTVFPYGGMKIRNCIGWGAGTENHEFLSENKEGSQVPDTEYNSWTTLDGCSPYKESTKVNKVKGATKDYSGEFESLAVADFKAERQADGSLPDNGFGRLKATSTAFHDRGEIINGLTPARHISAEVAAAKGLELITADDLYIPYNDAAPEFGAYEQDGVPAEMIVPEKITLQCVSENSIQEVVAGSAISDIIYTWNAVGTKAEVTNLTEGLSCTEGDHTLTISGTPQADCNFTITVSGDSTAGVKAVTTTGIITRIAPYRVLMGDWYPLQDPWDSLPADLQGVLELIDGSIETSYSPTKTETDGSIPAGCTAGGIDMAKGNGGIRWKLPDGVLQLLINLHFTGSRTFKINWTLADGTTGSVTTASMKKQTLLGWNVLEQTGITDGTQVRQLELLNNVTSGGARVYDMYIRVPDTGEIPESPSSIETLPTDAGRTFGAVRKYVQGGRLVIERDGELYNAWGQRLELNLSTPPKHADKCQWEF
jgi:hypothetical protein